MSLKQLGFVFVIYFNYLQIVDKMFRDFERNNN